MKYDKKSFLTGLTVGMQLKGWASVGSLGGGGGEEDAKLLLSTNQVTETGFNLYLLTSGLAVGRTHTAEVIVYNSKTSMVAFDEEVTIEGSGIDYVSITGLEAGTEYAISVDIYSAPSGAVILHGDHTVTTVAAVADFYLYNGIELPAPPELTAEQKAMYPYSVLVKYADYPDVYRLFCMKSVEYTDSPGLGGVGWGLKLNGISITSLLENGVWSTFSEWNFLGVYLREIHWANFDVLNEDGSVYLAASEPVPVYK